VRALPAALPFARILGGQCPPYAGQQKTRPEPGFSVLRSAADQAA
jgi:hypothetical protein